MRIDPPAIRQPRRAWPISASAIVVLPEPDSPISASTCPGSMRNDTSVDDRRHRAVRRRAR
jgi:hypothetical protein